MERCLRISFARMASCFSEILDKLQRMLTGKGQAYQLIQETADEENLGLLTDPDLGLEDAVDLKVDDSKLREKAREIIEHKAAKKMSKVKAKYTEDANDDEDEWLDNLQASDDGN